MRKLLFILSFVLLAVPAAQAQTTDYSTFASEAEIRDGVLDSLRLDYVDRLPSGEFVFINGFEASDGLSGDLVGYDPSAPEGSRTRIIRTRDDLRDDLSGSGDTFHLDDLEAAPDGNIYIAARDPADNNQIYKTNADGTSESVLATVEGTDAIEVVGNTVYLGITGDPEGSRESAIYSISTTGTGQSGEEVLTNPNFNPGNQLEADADGNLYFLSDPEFSEAPFGGGALVKVSDPDGDAPSAEVLYRVFADGPFTETGSGIIDVQVADLGGAPRVYLLGNSFDGPNGEEFGVFQGDGSGNGAVYATETDIVADDDVEADAITGAFSPLYVNPNTGEQYYSNRESQQFGGLNSLIAITGAPLPVQFAGAPTATVEGRDVTLRWRTLSETNNAGFYAQHRRADASGDWQEADRRVAGAGTSTAENRYAFTVTGLQPGRYVFRVKQVDFDDAPSFSGTTEATVGLEGFVLRAATQNPFHGQTRLSYNAPEGTQVKATLYNSLGQQVRSLRPSGGQIEVSAGSLASGLYFVRLTTEDGRTASQSVTLVR